MSIDGRTAYHALSPLAVARDLHLKSSPIPAAPTDHDGYLNRRGVAGAINANYDAGGGGAAGRGGRGGGGGDWGDLGACAGAAGAVAAVMSGTRGGSEVARFFPPVLLLHGTADKTVPHFGTVLMHEALVALGVRAWGTGRRVGIGCCADGCAAGTLLLASFHPTSSTPKKHTITYTPTNPNQAGSQQLPPRA